MTSPASLVIATPCYGGQVTSLYATSLLKLQQAFLATGEARLKVLMMGGDALITRARANLVAHFLDDPAATHLLFIDADIAFEPEQVRRLLTFGAEVSAAIYPAKKTDWAKAKAAVAKGMDPETASLNYVLEFPDPSRIGVRDGFAKASYAGTGFLMIRRAALETMCGTYPALQYRREHATPDPLASSPHRFALFDCMIDAATGTYLSEDYSFCKRWTDLGGDIWIDLESRLTHTGPVSFHGDLRAQLGEAKG